MKKATRSGSSDQLVEIAARASGRPIEKVLAPQGNAEDAFRSYLGYVHEIIDVLALCIYAVNSLSGLERLSKALKKDASAVDQARSVEQRAAAERDRGFPLLMAHSLVSVWAALEAAIWRWAPRWIAENRAVLSSPPFEKIKLPASALVASDFADAASIVVDEIARQTNSALKPGVGRFTELFEVLGINVQISDDRRRMLYEMSKLRNVFVHQFGIADTRFARDCPGLGFKAGDRVSLDGEEFRAYCHEACCFVADIIEAADAVSASLAQVGGPKPKGKRKAR